MIFPLLLLQHLSLSSHTCFLTHTRTHTQKKGRAKEARHVSRFRKEQTAAVKASGDVLITFHRPVKLQPTVGEDKNNVRVTRAERSCTINLLSLFDYVFPLNCKKHFKVPQS